MALEDLAQTIGLPGIVIGTMIEGEVVGFLGGAMAHRGVFHVEAAAMAAVLGAALCDNGLFLAGRYLVRSSRVTRMLDSGVAGRLRIAMARRPTRTIVALRFLYGARLVGLVLAGSSGISWSRFALWNMASVLVWAHVVTYLGYGAGAAIEAFFGRLTPGQHVLIVGGAAVFFGLAVLGVRWLRRRSGPPPA